MHSKGLDIDISDEASSTVIHVRAPISARLCDVSCVFDKLGKCAASIGPDMPRLHGHDLSRSESSAKTLDHPVLCTSYVPATACVQNRALQHHFVLGTLCGHVVLLLASFPLLPMLLHRHRCQVLQQNTLSQQL